MKINKRLANSSNYSVGRKGKKIEYIVIHYTANNGDTAVGNCKYFEGANRGASAHYFVDEKEIWQSVEDKDTAWHCGAKVYKHKYCRNENSIGIEQCSRKDSKGKYYIKEEVVKNAVELTKELMRRYNIPEEKVIRHYDVTGKLCPEPMVREEEIWKNFKNKLVEEEEGYMRVKRVLEINGVRKELEVINDGGKNYYSITDIASMLGKEVSYDANTKVTILK